MEKEISMFKRGKNEPIYDLFTRIYQTVKTSFPSANIWLVEETGKRFSYIKGDTLNIFRPLRINISEHFWVFICDNNYQEEIKKILIKNS